MFRTVYLFGLWVGAYHVALMQNLMCIPLVEITPVLIRKEVPVARETSQFHLRRLKPRRMNPMKMTPTPLM